MQIKNLNIRPIVSIVLIIMVAFFCQSGPAVGASVVSTDKDIYHYGDMIKVNFSNAPGNEGDWISIVPAGSPDTEGGGDFKFLPKGLIQGVLTFDAPSPGKYEVRAYYNYSRIGYVVSGRYAFSVVSSPDGEAAMIQRMERKIDPNNPLEANLSTGQALVYIFRESMFAAYSLEVQITANGKPVVAMSNASYYPFPVSAGNVDFATGAINENFPSSNLEVRSMRECKATIKVKPGHVYYLRLKMIPMPFWMLYLEHVPHQEGANIIQSYRLTQIKR